MAYAVWNPSDKEASLILSNGNLTVTQPGSSGWRSVRSTESVSSGKHYWEIEIDDAQGGDTLVGVGTSSFSLSSYVGSDANSYGWYGSGTKYTGASSYPYAPTYTTGDIVGIALDLDNGKIWFSKNGSWTGDPVAGTGEAFSGLSGEFYAAVSLYNANKILTANFGTSGLTYSAPTGFTAGLFNFVGYFTGYVYEQGSPVSRKLYLHYRDDGSLMDTTTSSGNGYYYLETTYSGSHYIVCLDNAAGEDYNDLIIGNVFPEGVV
jgi:hypothetical protein